MGALTKICWKAVLLPPGLLALATRKHMSPEVAWYCAVLFACAARMWRRWGLKHWAAAVIAARLLLPRRARSPQLCGHERRSIFITGAASGIGLATAQLFHRRGWFVGLYDINAEALPAAVASLGPAEGRHCSGVVDVTDSGSCSRAVGKFIAAAGGRFDCLFNSAGLLNVCNFAEEPVEKQLPQVRVNVDGVIRMTHAAHAALKATPGSRVVTMASLASVAGAPSFAVYCGTKGAVAQLSDSLSNEYRRNGDDIAVTDVAVGFVTTPMVLNQAEIQRKQAQGRVSALSKEREMVTPDVVALTVWRAAHGAPGKVHYQTDAVVLLLWRLHGLDRLLGTNLLSSLLELFEDE
eukprot:TRINITY_DN6189_c0_g2_i1.p1 TRINITY_DN6189_c0_g2~~TRINITY_DN6189_c0_g2_i1.p1  ORF type:complete len:351 (+),score=96.50 TRINITY_DN6189_c0_g2_i1:161-1213(+)